LFKQFFTEDSRVQSFVGEIDKYLEIYPINISGTWETEAEIFATSLLLKTSIFIYSNHYCLWQLFGKDGTYKDGISNSENCLYISHVNRNH